MLIIKITAIIITEGNSLLFNVKTFSPIQTIDIIKINTNNTSRWNTSIPPLAKMVKNKSNLLNLVEFFKKHPLFKQTSLLHFVN
jgi:hypothetical protein